MNEDLMYLLLVGAAGVWGVAGAIAISLNGTDDSDEKLTAIWWVLGTFVVTLGVFGYSWWWAISNWGWLLGIAFGWIPAVVVAAFAGLLWPLVISIGAVVLIYLGRCYLLTMC